MILCIFKENNILGGYDTQKIVLSNGNVFLPNVRIIYDKEVIYTYEVQTVPKEVEPYKYCYTPEKGFYLNPNWQPPSPYPTVPPEIVELIKADYTGELISQGVI